jgi:hypothetical protein
MMVWEPETVVITSMTSMEDWALVVGAWVVVELGAAVVGASVDWVADVDVGVEDGVEVLLVKGTVELVVVGCAEEVVVGLTLVDVDGVAEVDVVLTVAAVEEVTEVRVESARSTTAAACCSGRDDACARERRAQAARRNCLEATIMRILLIRVNDGVLFVSSRERERERERKRERERGMRAKRWRGDVDPSNQIACLRNDCCV